MIVKLDNMLKAPWEVFGDGDLMVRLGFLMGAYCLARNEGSPSMSTQ